MLPISKVPFCKKAPSNFLDVFDHLWTKKEKACKKQRKTYGLLKVYKWTCCIALVFRKEYGHGFFNEQSRSNLNCSFSEDAPKRILCSQNSPKDKGIELDKIDTSIIMELCSNTRKTATDIARNLSISPNIVSYRLKKLEEQGIILAYRAVVNYKKLGLEYYKIFFNLSSYDRNEVKKVKDYLLSHKYTLYMVEGIGISDKIDIEILCPSHDNLLKFLDEVMEKFPTVIDSHEIITFRETLKTSYFPEN